VSLGHLRVSDWDDPVWVALVEPTLGGPNAARDPGDVIISEVYYNPADPDGGGRTKPEDVEFVEITNRTDSPVDLGGWQVTGPSDSESSPNYEFPAGTIIDPAEALVIVSFDPTDNSKAAIFKFTLGMELAAPLYGELSTARRFELDNTGGIVQLKRPGDSPPDDPSFTPYYLVDEIQYGAAAPWPDSPASGAGDALARTQTTDYGNFPTSWVALPATPGTAVFSPRSIGDSNEDGQFDQDDLGLLLPAGKYMTGQPATWAEGDWTGDGLFDQRDIVAALRSDSYVQGAVAVLSADSDAENMDRVFAGWRELT